MGKKYFNAPYNVEIIRGRDYVCLKYKGMNYGRIILSGKTTEEDIAKAVGELETRVNSERRSVLRGDRRKKFQ